MQSSHPRRVVVISGGAGTIGSALSRRFLAAGCHIVITGRNAAKLQAFAAELAPLAQAHNGAVTARVLDGSDVGAVRRTVNELFQQLGRLDVIINNAGSAGARRTLAEIPLSAAEAAHNGDSETLADGFGNLLGISWNLSRAVADLLQPGACIINVSTIFSLTPYYGRIPYSVPKAALNALSGSLAAEFGARGVRVLTVMPGPIAGERIDRVFSQMDALQQIAPGSTAATFLATMQLQRPQHDGRPARSYPTADDVAATIALLVDPANAAVTAQTVAVTNGMLIADERPGLIMAPPELPALHGRRVLLTVEHDAAQAAAVAAAFHTAGAAVVCAVRDPSALALLRTRLPADCRVLPCELTQHEQVAAFTAQFADDELPDTVVIGSADLRPYHDSLLGTTDSQVAAYQQDVLISRVALAVALARRQRDSSTPQLPTRLLLCSADGSSWPQALQRAASRQLARIWQQEAAATSLVRHLLIGQAASPAEQQRLGSTIAWAAAALTAALPLELHALP